VVAVSVVVVVVCVWLFRPSAGSGREVTYQGQTLEQWFNGAPSHSNTLGAFRAIGTNALPFLASRINRRLRLSLLESFRVKLRDWVRVPISVPRSRLQDAQAAAALLSEQLQPPGEILLPLLEPALRSTQIAQRILAFQALQGISSGYDLGRSHVEQALGDPVGYCCRSKES